MRKQIVAGNWKMNTTLSGGIELAEEINRLVKNPNNVTVILAPPFIHLSEIFKTINKNRIFLAAQNCSTEPNGAFTGEISAEMIKSAGAKYVIIGHSERREYYFETDETLFSKINMTLNNDLVPIFCCGEKLDEREKNIHFNLIKQQINNVLFKFPKNVFSGIIIAYEPVWAIGTGKTATSDQAQEMHFYIRKLISEFYDEETADNTSILYGGSCKPANAKEIFAKPDVDGGLIGGASLKAQDFFDIISSF